MSGKTPHLVALLTLCVFVLGGCHARHGSHTRDFGPLQDHYGQARSLALPTQMNRSASASAQAMAYEPWYVGRNDIVPSVSVGYDSTRFERSVTYTRDQQLIVNGRVYDRYNQTTYRRTVSESTR